MKRRRVVITGLGVIAPNGIGKEAFWQNLLAGKSGIRPLSMDQPNPPCHVAGEVEGFDIGLYIPPDRFNAGRRMSRASQFAVACAKMAVADAGLDRTQIDPRRVGVCFGTSTGKHDVERDHLRFLRGHSRGLGSLWTEFPPHGPTFHLSEELGVNGPMLTCSGGCSTGLMALEWGASQIEKKAADVMLAGSAEAPLSPFFLTGLGAGVLFTRRTDPSQASRPYDRYRDGLVPSEAAGIVLLESLESAMDRGAPIYAEYLGYASSADPSEAKEPEAEGRALAAAVRDALKEAGLEARQIDCINAHGLSHPVYDRTETRGFKLALGSAAYHTPVTSIKSMTGASFSADGILQIISSCMMLKDGIVPPTTNLQNPDPDCDLDYVPNQSRIARLRNILTNTRAVGGAHAVAVLGRVNG